MGDPDQVTGKKEPSAMSEQKESSVLFSLKELMSLEEDRIRSEEADKSARAHADEQARLAAERAARDAEEARIRAEEERRRAEEQRSREETARLEAIRQAEVERARMEAEGQARIAAMSAQQSHERQLEAIRTDKGKKTLRNVLIGGVVLVLAIGGTVGFVVYDNTMKAEQREKDLQAEAAIAKEEKDKLQAQLKAQADTVKNLESSVANEKDERKKAELQAQLAAAKEQEANTQKALGRPGGARPAGDSGAATPKQACNCKPTDPLCDCL
jgi:colicin import membrane protein